MSAASMASFRRYPLSAEKLIRKAVVYGPPLPYNGIEESGTLPTIRKEIVIAASPEQVWDAVRDVGAVHHRLVPGYTENTLMDGNERTLVLPNGGMTRELIVSIDDAERRMAYAVVEGRMPLQHHHASFQVLAHDQTSSKLVWITDFLPEQLTAEIQVRVDRGAQVMKATIEAEAQRDTARSAP